MVTMRGVLAWLCTGGRAVMGFRPYDVEVRILCNRIETNDPLVRDYYSLRGDDPHVWYAVDNMSPGERVLCKEHEYKRLLGYTCCVELRCPVSVVHGQWATIGSFHCDIHRALQDLERCGSGILPG